MKNVIALGLLFAATATVATAQTFDEARVKSACSAEWGNEFDMVAFCIKKRQQGFNNFLQTLQSAPDYLDQPMSNCLAQWQDEWDMVAFCAKKQVEAAASLNENIRGLPKDIGTKIIMNCSMDWADDYAMIAYCAKKQSEAWREINE